MQQQIKHLSMRLSKLEDTKANRNETLTAAETENLIGSRCDASKRSRKQSANPKASCKNPYTASLLGLT